MGMCMGMGMGIARMRCSRGHSGTFPASHLYIKTSLRPETTAARKMWWQAVTWNSGTYQKEVGDTTTTIESKCVVAAAAKEQEIRARTMMYRADYTVLHSGLCCSHFWRG